MTKRFAGGDSALGYGEPWAFARDNFCPLAQDFVTVTGERSSNVGPNGESISYATRAEDTNLASDLFWQSVISSGIIARDGRGAATDRSPRYVRCIPASSMATSPTWLRAD